MAAAAAPLRTQLQQEEEEGGDEESAKAEPNCSCRSATEKWSVLKHERNARAIEPSPAQRAASNQLRGLTGLTPIGVHVPRPRRQSGDDWRSLLRLDRKSREEEEGHPANPVGSKLPLAEKEESPSEPLFPPSVDPLLASTAVNLDSCLDAHDVARAVKDTLNMEMPLDAVAGRLIEGNAVEDTMAVELSHVPPHVAVGVSSKLAVPMYRAPGHLLPSALEE